MELDFFWTMMLKKLAFGTKSNIPISIPNLKSIMIAWNQPCCFKSVDILLNETHMIKKKLLLSYGL